MKFVAILRKRLKLTRYGLAKKLELPVQSIDHLEIKGQSIRPETLCKLRIAAGISWSEMGRILDKEYL